MQGSSGGAEAHEGLAPMHVQVNSLRKELYPEQPTEAMVVTEDVDVLVDDEAALLVDELTLVVVEALVVEVVEEVDVVVVVEVVDETALVVVDKEVPTVGTDDVVPPPDGGVANDMVTLLLRPAYVAVTRALPTVAPQT